jgi:hypoxanthine phosphoribosyltransferase/transcriptional regulator with XRE-family HTH domain
VSKKAKVASDRVASSGRPRGELGSYLHSLRRERGLSLREASARTGDSGLSRSYLSQVETGKILRPRHDALAALATAYQADYWELLRRSGYSVPPPQPGGARGSMGTAAELPEWLPRSALRLSRDDQNDLSRYVEYLRWREERSSSRSPDRPPGGLSWIPWEDVHEWTHELSAELRQARFDPDLVIGLGRGGAILGGLIAGALGLKPVTVLDMKHKPGERPDERFIEGQLDLRKKKSALLVQGEVRTGKSLAEARKLILEEAKTPDFNLMTIALVAYPEVPPELQPNRCQIVARHDPPWRRLPGYARTLRDSDDDP